jgi:hypothetical protein
MKGLGMLALLVSLPALYCLNVVAETISVGPIVADRSTLSCRLVRVSDQTTGLTCVFGVGSTAHTVRYACNVKFSDQDAVTAVDNLAKYINSSSHLDSNGILKSAGLQYCSVQK